MNCSGLRGYQTTRSARLSTSGGGSVTTIRSRTGTCRLSHSNHGKHLGRLGNSSTLSSRLLRSGTTRQTLTLTSACEKVAGVLSRRVGEVNGMPMFKVEVRGDNLVRALQSLNGASIPTIG